MADDNLVMDAEEKKKPSSAKLKDQQNMFLDERVKTFCNKHFWIPLKLRAS
jgi:hypothetical protein